MKFNRHKLMDTKGTGLVAATYLVPEGWKVEDNVEWNIHNVAQPATAELLIFDEETQSSMQGFPNNAWTDNSGSVILSNDAGYDPNVGGSSSWSSLDLGGSTVSAPAATSTETE